ncbi:transposase [Pseudonocardia saturnea]
MPTGHRPDHATIARFRARHETGLETLFCKVLQLCAQAGMVDLALLALDGTKIGADASWSANRTREQLNTEIVAMLAERGGRLARLREARDRPPPRTPRGSAGRARGVQAVTTPPTAEPPGNQQGTEPRAHTTDHTPGW